MFFKSVLKFNGFFAVISSSTLVFACATNSGLEVRVALNDFGALANIFANDNEQWNINYEFKLKNPPTIPEEGESEVNVTPQQMIFATNSNYIINNCTDYLCEAKTFIGKTVENNTYNNLNYLAEFNYAQSLESSQFSIDNLAKKLDIVPFAENSDLIYDFSMVLLETDPSNFTFFYNKFENSDILYYYSNQHIKITNQINGVVVEENFNLFDLRQELTMAMIEKLIGYKPMTKSSSNFTLF